MFSMYSHSKVKKGQKLDTTTLVSNMKTLDEILQSGFKIDEKDLEKLFMKKENLTKTNNESDTKEL